MSSPGTYGPYNDIELTEGDYIVISSQPCEEADFSVAKKLDDDKTEIFDFNQMDASQSYRICICQKSVWTGDTVCPSPISGGSMAIQDSMTEIIFNQVRGTRITIPQGWCEGTHAGCTTPPMTAAYHLPGAGTVGSVSLVSVDRSCMSPAGNPSAGGATASGHLPSDASRNIIGSLDNLVYMTSGWYKACYKPDTSNTFNWQESGVVVALQNQVSSLEINALTAVAAIAPQVCVFPTLYGLC